MRNTTFFPAVMLTLAVLASGCFDGNGNENVGSMYEPGPYEVLTDEDIVFANGLAHTQSSVTPAAVPLLLDVYSPDSDSMNRPVMMFIHGGGFTGGTKQKPEIVEMARYYASRGWVYVSIDYRTAEELGNIDDMSQQEVVDYYRGIAPQEWVERALEGAETSKEIQQAVAMYTAQRDAKAALRWVVANAGTYNINTDEIAVGGASAGAITTIALGMTELGDFRDEISIEDDSTLSTTNLNQTYQVQSMVYFWGSNLKLDLFNSVYGVDRYDSDDPELFMAHGTDDRNPSTAYSEATELQGIFDSLGIYNQLVTLEGKDHGAWNATVDGKGIFELSFDFLVDRQNLDI